MSAVAFQRRRAFIDKSFILVGFVGSFVDDSVTEGKEIALSFL
jgi:hypothetical protein